MRIILAAGILAAAVFFADCRAADLTNAQAEELLKRTMTGDCGSYYVTQGEEEFSDLEGKTICTYKPRVTNLSVVDNTATADFNRDRAFDPTLSDQWLKDYAKMEAAGPPSLLFKTLKDHLVKWLADGGVDHGARPGRATFKYDGKNWLIGDVQQ